MIIVLSSLIVVPLIGGKLMYDQQHESLPCKLFWMLLQPALRTKMMRSCPRKLKVVLFCTVLSSLMVSVTSSARRGQVKSLSVSQWCSPPRRSLVLSVLHRRANEMGSQPRRTLLPHVGSLLRRQANVMPLLPAYMQPLDVPSLRQHQPNV